MDILQQTLPNFFTSGLVATNYHLPIHMHGLLDTNLGNKAKVKAREDLRDDMIEEGIYARNIRLEYTPPVALPAPLPRVLSVEGLPLYVTSSIFVRHALNALYTDLAVSLHKVHIRSGPPAAIPPTKPVNEDQARRRREKAIMISILVSGMSRLGLSTERAEWDVTSTYTFCPHTGRVARHTVNAIDPAPSETVYTALTSALATLSGGLRGPNREGKGAMNVMVKPKIESEETKR
ncbi:hypothetical protein DFH11DRAFT_841289 [Phellopilus nigrolimitatus]|nr:hypothetical protein DFH11DRAFT_841289 [Phellopilus nigrolimitatus]